MSRRLAWALAGALLSVLSTPGAAVAGPGYVKYYVTASAYRGAPENADEIATRFLGTTGRAADVRALNPALAEALPPGTPVVLPFDAVGVGVRYGLLPVARTGCPPLPVAGDAALERIGVPAARQAATGEGVLVAVVGGGVDPARAGHPGQVEPGVNLDTGAARAGDRCGAGSAAAALVIEVAPAARILPVAVRAGAPGQAAAGIDVAVSAGAGVVLLTDELNTTDAAVRAAIRSAADHDVVVVARTAPSLVQVGPGGGLPASGLSGPPSASGPPGSLSAPGSAPAAGVAALVRSRFPRMTAAAVADRLTATAEPQPGGPALLRADRAVTEPLPAPPEASATGPWLAAGTLLTVAAAGGGLWRWRRRRSAPTR